MLRETEESQTLLTGDASTPGRTWYTVARTWLKRCLRVVGWLVVVWIGICIIYGLVDNSIEGGSSGGGGFGFRHLSIDYEYHSGGLLGENVGNIVILYTFPRAGQCGDESGRTYLFDDGHTVTVQPRRNETLWVDERGYVTNLGQVLGPRDIKMLMEFPGHEEPAITSPEEFLSVLGELRAKAGIPNEPFAAAAKKRCEKVAAIVKSHYKSQYGFEARGPVSLTQFEKEEKESYGPESELRLKLEDGKGPFADSLLQGGRGWVQLHSKQGDQLFFFTSDARSRSDGAGTRGYVIMRKNEIVELMVESRDQEGRMPRSASRTP
jgi:hypothetical protein